jgi:DNA-binding HxlR family transcriptional regulator
MSARSRTTRPPVDPRPFAPPPRAANPGCHVTELFALLGQPHMLEILHTFEEQSGAPIRFTALQHRLGISPKTLSNRLRRLVESGFLARRAFDEIPPRVEYQPTEKTHELGELFRVLEEWSDRNSLRAIPTVTVVGRASA